MALTIISDLNNKSIPTETAMSIPHRNIDHRLRCVFVFEMAQICGLKAKHGGRADAYKKSAFVEGA